ncbi:MAG: hypothetical protein HY904_09690 [Deltaproteobacteria bacterium]|nr:hypothetical protein [Deltaproteobacteria bacterium]
MRRRWRQAEALAVAALLLVLFSSTGTAFQDLASEPMSGDLPGFLDGARHMRFFYDSGYREPLHVFFLKVALAFVDDGYRAARLVTVVHTLLLAVAAWWFARVWFGPAFALACLAIVASNRMVAFYSVSGLRDPLYTAVLLLFGTVLFLPHGRLRPLTHAVLAGACGALLVLTRVYGWAAIALCLTVLLASGPAWRAETRGGALRFAGITLAVTTVLVLPGVLAGPSRVVGSDVNFWRNVERTGSPGDWEHTPAVGIFQYMFGEHSLADVVARCARNTVMYVSHYFVHYLGDLAWLALFFPLGAVLATVRGRAHVVALFLAALGPIVFVLNLNQMPGAQGVEMRLVHQVFPFALVLALYGAACPLAWAWRRAASTWPRLPQPRWAAGGAWPT